MLVYAPGRFFLEHQDSEKDDAMIASLVVGLPSTFKGGALEVRHGGQTATYRGSKKALSFVAFYSDCRHQVRPVASGYRAALTYNLLLREEPAGSAIEPDPELVDYRQPPALSGLWTPNWTPTPNWLLSQVLKTSQFEGTFQSGRLYQRTPTRPCLRALGCPLLPFCSRIIPSGHDARACLCFAWMPVQVAYKLPAVRVA
jgi:2OG-Fe(II) oxygenase superfamily